MAKDRTKRRIWRPKEDSKAYREYSRLLEKRKAVRDLSSQSYKSKIFAFYNPNLHTVFTAKEFLEEFLAHLRKNGDHRLADWIEKNKSTQYGFLHKLIRLKDESKRNPSSFTENRSVPLLWR